MIYVYLGSTGLMAASWQGHLDVVKVLVENEAEVNAKNNKGKIYL